MSTSRPHPRDADGDSRLPVATPTQQDCSVRRASKKRSNAALGARAPDQLIRSFVAASSSLDQTDSWACSPHSHVRATLDRRRKPHVCVCRILLYVAICRTRQYNHIRLYCQLWHDHNRCSVKTSAQHRAYNVNRPHTVKTQSQKSCRNKTKCFVLPRCPTSNIRPQRPQIRLSAHHTRYGLNAHLRASVPTTYLVGPQCPR